MSEQAAPSTRNPDAVLGRLRYATEEVCSSSKLAVQILDVPGADVISCGVLIDRTLKSLEEDRDVFAAVLRTRGKVAAAAQNKKTVSLAGECGIAKITVLADKFVAKPEAAALKESIGSYFDRVFEPTTSFTLKADMVAELRRRLGADFEQFVTVQRGYALREGYPGSAADMPSLIRGAVEACVEKKESEPRVAFC